MDKNKEAVCEADCSYTSGQLPTCAPLAAAYIPRQQEALPRYNNMEALTRGTLFPGLDLPFLNQVNRNNPYAGTPLGELMALDFVFHELNLYLDTHPNDTEAFTFMKKIGKLLEDGRATYTKKYGPVFVEDVVMSDAFSWVCAPWPWMYDQRGE